MVRKVKSHQTRRHPLPEMESRRPIYDLVMPRITLRTLDSSPAARDNPFIPPPYLR
jgi:hypothetical protein